MFEKEHKYRVFVFRAVDKPELCEEYIHGHIRVLLDYGIENITSNNQDWVKNPDVYCLGLETLDGELLGGIRIQLANGVFPLPIEDAIGYVEQQIHNVVEHYALNGGVGELSGLWVSNKLKGLGVGWYLVRAAISTANQLNFKTLIGICGEVTLNMFQNVGFEINYSLGNNGTFLYPNDRLIAYAVGILNIETLEKASTYDKDIMLSLREAIVLERTENDRKIDVLISYNLRYKNVGKLKFIKNNE